MKIHVDDGTVILATADQTPENALEAHGFDPEAVEYSVEPTAEEEIKELRERVEALESR